MQVQVLSCAITGSPVEINVKNGIERLKRFPVHPAQAVYQRFSKNHTIRCGFFMPKVKSGQYPQTAWSQQFTKIPARKTRTAGKNCPQAFSVCGSTSCGSRISCHPRPPPTGPPSTTSVTLPHLPSTRHAPNPWVHRAPVRSHFPNDLRFGRSLTLPRDPCDH